MALYIMPYKGFVFNSTNIRTLLDKLNNFVVATNSDNLTDLKIYKRSTFNAKFPKLFVETSLPDNIIKGDDQTILISSIGTGTGKVMLNGRELEYFSLNAFIGGKYNYATFVPDVVNYGILFPYTDWISEEGLSAVAIWRNSKRLHIIMSRVELWPDNTNAEVGIRLFYNFNDKNIYISIGNLLNFSKEPLYPFRFGIFEESTNINTDVNIVKINIDAIDLNISDGLNLYKYSNLTATELKDAGFTATELKAAGFTAIELKAAGFQDIELLNIGYSIEDIIIDIITDIKNSIITEVDRAKDAENTLRTSINTIDIIIPTLLQKTNINNTLKKLK